MSAVTLVDQLRGEGILAWWGDMDFPDGGEAAIALDQNAWTAAYCRLQHAAGGSESFVPFGEVRRRAARIAAGGIVPIAVARFDLAAPGPELDGQIRQALGAGTLLHLPNGTLGDRTRKLRAFIAGPLLPEQWGVAVPRLRGDPDFVIDESLFLGGDSALPTRMQISVGGGSPRTVRLGEPFHLPRPRTGEDPVFRLDVEFGETRSTARFSLERSEASRVRRPDQFWSLEGRSIDDRPGNTGTAYVYLAAGASGHRSEPEAASSREAVRKPVIIAGGFPGSWPYEYLFDQMNQNETIERLHRLGYDVVLLSFDQGTDLIQRNAEVMIACIHRALETAQAPLVVGGISMGGLVARYALLRMEAERDPHLTAVYLSVDTPHQGAYTSLALQWFAHYLQDASPLLQEMSALLRSPANRQFLRLVLDGEEVRESRERQDLMRELLVGGKEKRYPSTRRRLAIASGRGDGKREVDEGAILHWNLEPFVRADLRSLSVEGLPIAEGSSIFGKGPARLEYRSDVPWEMVPGGTNSYNALAWGIAEGVRQGSAKLFRPRSCAVPTVSALDIDTADPFAPIPPPSAKKSPFHDYIHAAENEPHATINAQASRWLVRQLFDPHAPDFLADPYPTYAFFRKNDPVIPAPAPYDGHWVFGYEDVRRVLEETETFVKRLEPAGPGVFAALANMPDGLFSADPPRHTCMRKVFEGVFEHAIFDADGLARDAALEALAGPEKRGRIELVADFATPVPSSVLRDVLGIPRSAWPLVEQWVATIAAGHDRTQPLARQLAAGTASMALSAYYQALIRGFHPRQGSRCPRLVELMSTVGAEEGIAPEEVQASAVNFNVAGFVSAAYLIGTGVLNLLRHPQQLEWLRQDVAKKGSASLLLASAIHEMLRFDPPAQLVDRWASEDVRLLGGQLIRKGERITAVLGSANRDPHAFGPDAETFRIDRRFEGRGQETEKSLAFGSGIHECIGAPLVYRSAPVAIACLLERLPDLALDGDPQWQTDPYLRGLTSLPLKFGTGPSGSGRRAAHG